jgi:PST family polysaccharide transporter
VEHRAIRGIPWVLVTYALTKVVTLATTLVLARLLAPADFGLMALAWLIVGLLQLLRDSGLGSVLILRQDLDAAAQATVLTLMVAIGAVFTVLLLVLSPVAAAAFDQPRLQAMLAALSVSMVISSVGGFYEALQQRELSFRHRFLSQLALALGTSTVSITLAVAGAGVWSFVGGHLAGTVLYTVVLVALAPNRFRPAVDRGVAREALRSGRGFVMQGLVDFLQQNADYVAVGRTLGTRALGYYSMAFRLGELPYLSVADPIARVTFPAFARMRDRGEAIAPSFLTVLRLTALVTCPMGVLLSALADPFTRTVLGTAWLATIGPLAVFGVWGSIRTLQATVMWLLNSAGHPGVVAKVGALRLGPLVVALVIAAQLGDITTVAAVMLADVSVALVVLAALAQRRAHVPLADQWHAVRPILFACIATWVASWGLVTALDGAAPVAALVVPAAGGLVTYVLCLVVLEPGLIGTALRQVRRIVARAPDTVAAPLAPESAPR